MSTEQDIRDQLEHLLARDTQKIDYGMVLDLASQLSEYDKENVRFAVDGNLVKRLGEQLVAKKTTALSELIKNSYDADASKVDVIFESTEEQPGGTITIEDDGNGMTKQALVKGFMTISTSDKEDNPVSPLYERPRAGRKGIGRFSAQKIGRHLTVITRTSKNEPYSVIEIDWNDYQPKSNLLTIANSIRESDFDYGFEKGTKLIISGTKEVWSDRNQATTFKYISSVIKNSPRKLQSGIIDPGFNPVFYSRVPISNELFQIKSDDTEFLSEATGLICAYVTEDGRLKVTIEGIKDTSVSDDYEFPEACSDVLKAVDFKFRAHYFNVPIGKNKYLHSYLIDNGGVKLYRNGFYVAPYGGRRNDWLGLDDSVRRRRILPPHANTNFVGSIDITDINGELFEETSSREGLIENRYFEELGNSAYRIITSAVGRIASTQGRKVTASQSGFVKKEKTLEEKYEDNQSKLRNVAASIATSTSDIPSDNNQSLGLFPDDSNSTVIDNSVVLELQEGLNVQDEIIKELIDEKNMYRVLSSSGLAIAEFTHEIQLYLNALTLNGKQLRRSVLENPIALKSAKKIENNIEMLVSYTDFFTDTIRNNSHRTKEVLELRYILNQFFDAMQPTIDRRAYDFITEFEGDDFWTKQMHISEISSVLMNLFTNSCKAIVRANPSKGKIKVSLTSVDDSHIIKFEDNGDGIPKDKWGKVFSPLFTTELAKGAYSYDGQQMRGMGLGLTITQDIVNGFEGEISVIEPSKYFSTCIQVIIPKAAENEVPEDVY
ncbi:sensor histidine kinase [Vibrio kanaloae]|uniref:sensor histidine kinase n=1 Tax=Vibrio kanaloae TaxID=170673 RepID=UPI001EFCCA2A|nr:sensor histidine kinase [Vibrio kanaloae]MCG9557922.1 ATP-binding protein [Vibrio kanaloae]